MNGKKIITLLVVFVLQCGWLIGNLSAKNNEKPFVIPEVKAWSGGEGAISLSGRIIVKNKNLEKIAYMLVEDYKLISGKSLTVVKGKAGKGDIILSLQKEKDNPGPEGYRLNADKTISLTAATSQGVFWATRTFLQIMEQHKDGNFPRGTITDVPEYKLRGFMIDCGRKYIPMKYLRNLVKIMAYYKMNTLQVHLNDNGFAKYFAGDWNKTQAAFRLECDTYPGLTAKDGSYTKQEFIDFQKFAASLNVEIIPEIDVPAHSLAFTHYKPEIGSKEYGMDHLDLFNPATYTFLDGLFKEYIGGKSPVFCGPRVHIGTDEYSNTKKEVVEKFRAFTDRYIKYVESFGKQAVVWGALTHANGTTPVKSKNVLMNCWYNGYADPKEMKKQGYQLVSVPDGLVYIVPAAGYYYDYLNCKYLYEHWTPAVIGDEKFEENDPSIEGGMFAVWNDHVGNGITVKDIHHRVYPALQTMAVKCWTGKYTSLPYERFDKLRELLSEAPGVNELARHGKTGTPVLQKSEVKAGDIQPVEEIGYNYAVSFNLAGVKEQNGTELFRSGNAVFYLADPQTGKLGFEREGYLNTFNYKVEEGKNVLLTITGDNHKTCLYVNGELREELGEKKLYVLREQDRAHFQLKRFGTFEPVVYAPAARMNYQRTLFFPLRKAGQFKSHITNLKVEVK